LRHSTTDIARAKHPTAAAEWRQVSIYHVSAPRRIGDEFLSTAGAGPDFLVKPTLCLKTGCNLSGETPNSHAAI